MAVASLGSTSFALGAHFIPGRRMQRDLVAVCLEIMGGGAIPVPQFSRADLETDWHCPVWMKLVLELTLEPGGGAGASRAWNHHQRG